MIKYVFKRLLTMIPLFITITFAVYFLANMAPGTIVDSIVASQQDITQEEIDKLYEEYHLNEPVVIRYVRWLGDLLNGDMGRSYRTNEPVANMISDRIGPTLILTGAALLIAIVIGIPLGVLSALKPKGFWDNFSSALTFLGSSFPAFFIALLGVYFFSVQLKILPSSGMYYSGKAHTFGSLIVHLIMPSAAIAFGIVGRFIKQTRGSMLEVLNEEYIKTARSKGIKEIKVIIFHALRNAMIPIVTAIGLTAPFLIGGAVVIEQIFGWPGLGTLMNVSIIARDYPAVMGGAVIICVVVLVCNLIVDLIYAWLDPRISYK